MKLKRKISQEGRTGLNCELYTGDSVFAENKLLKLLLGGVLLTTLLIYYSVQELKESYRAIIQFPGSTETMEITEKTADTRYLMMAAEFVTGTYFAATPASVDRQHSMLLTIVHPTEYTTIQKRLSERAQKIKRLQSAAIYGNINWSKGFEHTILSNHDFAVKDIHRLHFAVTRSLFFDSSIVPDQQSRSLYIDYTIENGRFWLVDLKEGQPRVK